MGQGITSNSPRQIFNDWDDNGLPAGEQHIGQVGKQLALCSLSVITATAGTYVSGDLAGTGGILEFTSAARVAGGKGCVRSAVFVDRGDQAVRFDLVLFSTSTVSTTFTEVTTMIIDDADLSKVVGVITCGTADYLDVSTGQVAWIEKQDVYFDLPAGATTLYGATRVAATWSPVTFSDLGIQLQIEQF